MFIMYGVSTLVPVCLLPHDHYLVGSFEKKIDDRSIQRDDRIENFNQWICQRNKETINKPIFLFSISENGLHTTKSD